MPELTYSQKQIRKEKKESSSSRTEISRNKRYRMVDKKR